MCFKSKWVVCCWHRFTGQECLASGGYEMKSLDGVGCHFQSKCAVTGCPTDHVGIRAFLRCRGSLLVRAGSSGQQQRVLYRHSWVLYDDTGTEQALANLVNITKAKVACRGMFALMDRKSLVNGLEPVEACPCCCWRTLRGPWQLCGHARLLAAPHSRRHRPV